MKFGTRIAVAAVLAIVGCTSIFNAKAMTLEALCASDQVTRSVLRFSKKLRYPANAGRMKPDVANFNREAGALSCTYDLTAVNVYDFGTYKATFRDTGYNQVKVISLVPVD